MGNSCSAKGQYHTQQDLRISQGRTKRDAPVVLASPALEPLAVELRRLLGSEEKQVPISWDGFKSGDPNIRFNFEMVVGRRVVLLFNTVDQSRLFEQLSLVQALQGFPVPDGDDAKTKWKTYVEDGSYSWGRASEIQVVIPWYRPCQMERTSRWSRKEDGSWNNADPNGKWLDVPTAQTMARLLACPGPPTPGKAPTRALDGRPLHPMWHPAPEMIFIELHEEEPVRLAVEGFGSKVRAERFVPYFVEKLRASPSFAGIDSTFILFPDHGAYQRYFSSVVKALPGLAEDHVLWITKTRVGESTQQVQKLFFDRGQGQGEEVVEPHPEKERFKATDHVCIIDDFTNSGGTLFGAVNLVRSKAGTNSKDLTVSIFVSHLVAGYDPEVVKSFQAKLHELGPKCKFYTTNTIPETTDLLKEDKQVEVFSIADFLATRLE